MSEEEEFDHLSVIEVFGSDGRKVGRVVGDKEDILIVESGFFYPVDYYVPKSVIAQVDNQKKRIDLSITKAEALQHIAEEASG